MAYFLSHKLISSLNHKEGRNAISSWGWVMMNILWVMVVMKILGVSRNEGGECGIVRPTLWYCQYYCEAHIVGGLNKTIVWPLLEILHQILDTNKYQRSNTVGSCLDTTIIWWSKYLIYNHQSPNTKCQTLWMAWIHIEYMAPLFWRVRSHHVLENFALFPCTFKKSKIFLWIPPDDFPCWSSQPPHAPSHIISWGISSNPDPSS